MRKALRRLYGAAILLSGAVFIGVLGARDAAAQGEQLYYVTTPGGQMCSFPCYGYSWQCKCMQLPPCC